MTIENRDIPARMRHFEEVCRGAGVKLTHQRMEVFREVAQNGEHPDAEAIYRGVRGRVPTVSLDTVYRALWLLADLGLITTLGPSRERTRFDANLERHHHFVCVRCGLTRDFYSDELDELTLPRSIQEIGRVETTQVEARGVCRDCAKTSSAETTTPRQKGPGRRSP